MIAIILNSGVGKRMQSITNDKPKAFVELSTTETIISRQLRILSSLGIEKFIITTGPFKEKFLELRKAFPKLEIDLIHNENYESSNSIYSLHLVPNQDDEVLILHGDLVFDNHNIMSFVEGDSSNSVITLEHDGDSSYKDFLGSFDEGFVNEIGVNISDQNVVRINPFFRLSKELFNAWKVEIHNFIKDGRIDEYAETALNSVINNHNLSSHFYDGFMEEIDNIDDLDRINNQILSVDYINQETRISNDIFEEIKTFILDNDINKPLFVHGNHIKDTNWFQRVIEQTNVILFSDYKPNPNIEEVLLGLKSYAENNCDAIIAIGGGSCIDVAKAIKLATHLEFGIKNFISSKFVYLPFMAIPTTAGSGSEATRYLVIYENGTKKSIVNHCLLPDRVILSTELLLSQPVYVKKASMMDALTQAIESAWSNAANEDSILYSINAVNLIKDNYKGYMLNDLEATNKIMIASNLAGKAINITATTAPHAFSYGITKNSDIAHGHAVGICFIAIMNYLLNNKVSDIHFVQNNIVFSKFLMNTEFRSVTNLLSFYEGVLKDIHLDTRLVNLEKSLILNSVNIERLSNFPIKLNENEIKEIISLMY